MAINPVKPITSENATATNGSATVSVSGSVDCSKIYQGSILHLGGNNPVEAISGTVPNQSGTSLITLRQPWGFATITSKLLVFNTIEGLVGAIQSAQQIVEQTSGIEAIGGTGFVEKTGDNTYSTSVATVKGKQILLSNDSQEARDVIGLGTASTLDVTTSSIDTTLNRVLKTGDFGLGLSGNASTPLPTGSIDSFSLPSGFFRVISSDIGARPAGFSQFGVLIVYRYDGTLVNQQYVDVNDKKATRVVRNGSVTDWLVIGDTGNDSLIDFGANSNGRFVRYPDGTQICYHALNSSGSAEVNWTFPSVFIDSPIATGSSATPSENIFAFRVSASSASSINFAVFTSGAGRIATSTRLIAIGRWR
jgi:hypothetical protein